MYGSYGNFTAHFCTIDGNDLSRNYSYFACDYNCHFTNTASTVGDTMSNRRLDLAIVRQQISNLLLANPELVDDDVLRADTIKGETDAFDLLRQCEAKRREARLLTAGIASVINELNARLARIERREQAIRQLAFKLMEAADLRKIELPEATYSISNSAPKVVIIDEDELPALFIRVKREPDKSAINAALKSGAIVPGATLNNPEPHLTIRTK